MSDYTQGPCSTIICGMTGSGKTSFAIRYLLNVDAVCRFIFDDMGQMSMRLDIPHASTCAELESALASRWVVYNPHRMFPGDTKSAFRFFCAWSFNACMRGPGKKVFFVDELWQWCNPNALPIELAKISQMGRVENLELVTATQRPHKINESITNSSTELVCFRLDTPKSLECVESLGAEPGLVQSLPLGSFVSWNRLSGGKLAGKLF